MKKLLLFFLLIFSFTFCKVNPTYAQTNLVPNPSFELYTACPTADGQIGFAPPWFNPTQGTPDYYNACYTNGTSWDLDVPANWIGFQNPKTGSAYAGISVSTAKYGESREYIEVKLMDSLLSGVKYYVSFYVSLADSMRYATDAIGAYISKDSVLNNNYLHLPYTPQISNLQGNIIISKQNWMQVNGEYIAQGGERFITIGNFKDDQNTDTLFLPDGGAPIPNHNTVYYYLDNICISNNPDTCNILTSIPSTHLINDIYVYPNPAKDYVMVRTYENNTIVNIYDTQNKIQKEIYLNKGKHRFSVGDLADGLYFVQIITSEKILFQKLIIKN